MLVPDKTLYAYRRVPYGIVNALAQLPGQSARALIAARRIKHICEMAQLNAEHSIGRRQERKNTEVVTWAVMRADEASISFRLAAPSVVHRRRERTVAARPIVVGDPIEIVVERALRLLVDDAEDLGDRRVPIIVHERGVIRVLVV